jgi:hypothetical protein
MTREDMFNYIYNNYGNLATLSFVKDLLYVVINDVEYMNNIDSEDLDVLDLGNNDCINKDDYESLVSIAETIFYIEKYNKEEKEIM